MQPFKSISYIHFDTIDSTNTWAKNNAKTLDPDQITCITALEQTAGRGRWLRKWISPKGQNIYATIYFCLSKNCKQLSNVGQILSLSCAKVLKSKGFLPQIKWPNDLLLEKKKVAGVLAVPRPRILVPGVAKARRLLVKQTIGLLALMLAYLQYYYIDVQLQILSLPSNFAGPLQ